MFPFWISASFTVYYGFLTKRWIVGSYIFHEVYSKQNRYVFPNLRIYSTMFNFDQFSHSDINDLIVGEELNISFINYILASLCKSIPVKFIKLFLIFLNIFIYGIFLQVSYLPCSVKAQAKLG